MGRGYAQIFTSVWSDDDFRSLSPYAQRHYFLLVSQPEINYAGVLALTERRWARCCDETLLTDVQAATTELADRRYVVVDYDTEELLVRSFVRRDGLWKQPKMLGVAVREALTTTSGRLREALAEEFGRVRELIPMRNPVDNRLAMLDDAIKDLMEGPALSPTEALGRPSAGPREGIGQGTRGGARAAPSPNTNTQHQHPKSARENLGGHRSESNAREIETMPPPNTPEKKVRPPERCTKHRNSEAEPGPCRGCMKAREKSEQWDRDTAKQNISDTRSCIWCDSSGWRIDPQHKHRGPISPGVRCDHTPLTAEQLQEFA